MKATKSQIKAWKKVYDTIAAEGEVYEDTTADNHAYWVNEESDFQSICVGWAVGQGMTLDEALDFYQQMIPLELF